MKRHAAAYLKELRSALEAIPLETLESIAHLLLEARAQDRQVFLLGNGGSASTASHFACDLGKGTAPRTGRRFRVIALTDNIPLLTAWANDTEYANVFVEQLRNLVNPGDVVLGLTGSGNSENVLRALSLARERGARTVALAGFDGGKVKAIAEVCLVVPTGRIEQAEDAHLILQHILCTYLRGAMAGGGETGTGGHK